MPGTTPPKPPTEDPNKNPSVTTEQHEEELQRLRAELAELKASTPKAKSSITDDKDGDTIVIHFVRDGWTSGDEEYYQGQEVEFTVGDQPYKDTIDPGTGKSWLDMRRDPREQEKRKGYEFFRDGPSDEPSYVDSKFEALKKLAEEARLPVPSHAELEAAEKAERGRRRKAQPILQRSNPQPRA